MELNLKSQNMGLLFPTTLCKLAPYIANITTGLKSNSVSESDQWILTVNTTEGRKTLFIKIFIHSIVIDGVEQEINATKNLEYEYLIYKEKIALIQRTCPFFIDYYGTGNACKAEDIYNLTIDQLQSNMIRNLYFLYTQFLNIVVLKGIHLTFIEQYTRDGETIRPTLVDELTTFESTIISQMIYELSNVRFSYIILENILIPRHMKNMSTILDCIRNPERPLITIEPCIFIWPILFQLIYTIFVMSYHNLMHNDLHMGNVFLQNTGTIQTFKFQIGDTIFNIRTQYMIKVYDFDIAYSNIVGENYHIPKLILNNFEFGPDNSYNVFRDVRKILYPQRKVEISFGQVLDSTFVQEIRQIIDSEPINDIVMNEVNIGKFIQILRLIAGNCVVSETSPITLIQPIVESAPIPVNTPPIIGSFSIRNAVRYEQDEKLAKQAILKNTKPSNRIHRLFRSSSNVEQKEIRSDVIEADRADRSERKDVLGAVHVSNALKKYNSIGSKKILVDAVEQIKLIENQRCPDPKYPYSCGQDTHNRRYCAQKKSDCEKKTPELKTTYKGINPMRKLKKSVEFE